ncbi:MAG: hypothetical protein ABJO27_10680 [Pseudoruegeria sp.]
MKLKKRQIETIKAEAEALTHKMPWERGARRGAFILRRSMQANGKRVVRA